MSWRVGLWLAGGALVIAAGATFFLTVQVPDGGGRPLACGSAWDVIAGRTGWQQWWAADLAAHTGSGPLARTEACPRAVNGRIVASAALAGGAAVVAAICAFVGRGDRQSLRVGQGRSKASRLRLFGLGVTALGAVLTAAGLIGIALIAAGPNAALFTFVSRTAVVLVGLLLLLPAMLLIVIGRGLSVLAGRDETT